jgi:hypothetical protein
VERRWLIGLGPPVLAALVLGALATPPAGAADRAWEPPPCTEDAARVAIAAAEHPAAARPVPHAWFTLDPRLDDAGTLTGQRLRIGLAAERGRYVDLPAESMAAGPFGRIVLVVSDDERRSEIRAIDARQDCAWALGDSSDVIRDVTLDPRGTAVWEFRVDRATRTDLGVWRRPLDGTPARRVLSAPPEDARFGRTWSTSLGWSLEGDRLVVESCGEHQCRSRVVDPATGRVQWISAAGNGQLIGVAGGAAVSYAACDVLPCAVVATDVASGERRLVAPGAMGAALVPTSAGPRIVLERNAGVDVLRLDGGVDPPIDSPDPSLRLVPTVLAASSGAGLPPDWIAWSSDGRSPASAALTRLSDGRTVPVGEVQP